MSLEEEVGKLIATFGGLQKAFDQRLAAQDTMIASHQALLEAFESGHKVLMKDNIDLRDLIDPLQQELFKTQRELASLRERLRDILPPEH